MCNYLQQIGYKVASLFVIAGLVLPSLVKLTHAIQHDHEHVVCIEKNQVHFHNVEYDCEFYKFNINHNLIFQCFNYEVKSNSESITSEIAYYTFLKSHQQLTSFLRGPPQHLV